MYYRVKLGKFDQAATAASNLSELELTLGEVAGAVGDAEQSVTYADRSGDAFRRCVNRVTIGDALHQAGSRAELRFALSFGFREEPVVYGDVVVERRADAIELRVLPRYPGWAARHRRLLCTVQLGTDRVGTECQVLLDRDLAPVR